jgi:hypothetical protein
VKITAVLLVLALFLVVVAKLRAKANRDKVITDYTGSPPGPRDGNHHTDLP